MGILSSIFILLQKAKPFESEPLDKLAEKMQTFKILKKDKLKRYYKVHHLNRYCLVISDTIFIDTEFYDLLLPEELLAVGAHEFNHINNSHSLKAFARTSFPTLIASLVIAIILRVNFVSINTFSFFRSLLGILIILFVPSLSLLSVLIATLYINAKWFRQQETDCDLSSVNFVNGDALIFALIKLNTLHSKKEKRSDFRFMPRLYPSLEQRINDIREAMKKETGLSN